MPIEAVSTPDFAAKMQARLDLVDRLACGDITPEYYQAELPKYDVDYVLEAREYARESLSHAGGVTGALARFLM